MSDGSNHRQAKAGNILAESIVIKGGEVYRAAPTTQDHHSIVGFCMAIDPIQRTYHCLQGGRQLTSISEVDSDSNLQILMTDGSIESKITRIHTDKSQ